VGGQCRPASRKEWQGASASRWSICHGWEVIALVSAPSNLGLRPPQPTSVPGCAKAPEALREAGLYRRLAQLGALDGGVVLPGRYADDAIPGAVRNQDAIVGHARRLATRITRLGTAGYSPLILGGDCSLLIAAGLAVRQAGQRCGLVHVDGHTDFRHPGNSKACTSLAGEDLAAAVGMHWPAVADIDRLGPYFRPEDAVHVGCRDDDEHLAEASAILAQVIPARRARQTGMAAAAEAALATVHAGHLDGYWLHLDVDVLEPAIMPAVDSPAPGGLDASQLADLLAELAPSAIGVQVTVFDPDLDPDGSCAKLISDILVRGLAELGTSVGRSPHRG
jgi:arginase